MIKTITPRFIEYGKKYQGLCATPYYGHAKGCPNYGNKETCPPKLPLINKVLDFDKKIYLIYTTFQVGQFAERMKQAHPEWADHPREWYNPRRWQPTARKEHQNEITRFTLGHPFLYVCKSPEAHGVNVSDLMEKVGTPLSWEWPPKHSLENVVYTVSLAGTKHL